MDPKKGVYEFCRVYEFFPSLEYLYCHKKSGRGFWPDHTYRVCFEILSAIVL